MTRRGVTKEGLGSGAYSIYRCDLEDADLVFGLGARERALAAKTAVRCSKTLLTKQISASSAQQLLDAVNLLRHVTFADQMQSMLDTQYAMTQAENSLKGVDVSSFGDIEHEFTALKEKADDLDAQIKELDGELGRLQQQLNDAEKAVKALSEHQEQTSDTADAKEDALRSIVGIWPDFDLEKRLEQADKEAEESPVDAIENLRKSVSQELNSIAYEIERNITEHNQTCQTVDSIVYAPDYRDEHGAKFFTGVCDLQREVERVHNRLKNNILVEAGQAASIT